jgi:hypothetical protein
VAEVLLNVSASAADLIVRGDVMAARSTVRMRIASVVEAERRGDDVAVRAAVMDLVAASGAWVAALDLKAPHRRVERAAAA